MTYKQALAILIESASKDIQGQGLGYRSTTNKWRRKVTDAIIKLFPVAYGHDMSYSEKYNFGIDYYEEEEKNNKKEKDSSSFIDNVRRIKDGLIEHRLQP